ncbi:MAG: helix-turn-helix domain-containing protein [Actinomycetota bacterium]|nr:helix-turn-helix domain-containing protein [Actinomycetota bacterium]
MTSALVRIGKAIGPARAAMIGVLFDGAPHAAGDLAAAAGVASATASQHLAIPHNAGVVTVYHHGRYRYYRLANSGVAAALEGPSEPDREPVTSLRMSREQLRVRLARTCYHHLAGQLGVALADRFIAEGWVDPAITTVTPSGATALRAHFGLDLDAPAPHTRRPVLRPCRDWTERHEHIAGRLGAQLATVALSRDWVARRRGSRGLTVTAAGQAAFQRLRVTIPPAQPTGQRPPG